MPSRKKKSVQKKRQQRPHPAGWDKAVKPLLSAANVERVSDTVARINIPACQDYDIDEDEIIRVIIPPSVLVNSTDVVNLFYTTQLSGFLRFC